MNQADVSVVAANYNNAEFLVDYFEGWISSSVQPRELIFVDDGSADDSISIARTYEAKLQSLIIIELERNVGFGNALNAGVERASCKYILRVDPDDVVMPDRLERQLALLESDQADVVGSNAVIFQSDGGATLRSTNFPRDHADIERSFLRGEHGVLHGTVMARSGLFKSHPYIQQNVPAEDYDIFSRMLRAGARFHNIQQPLLRYRVHQRSVSNALPFSTIQKTYSIRDRLFGISTSKLTVLLYYLHMKFYRNYLFSGSKVKKFFYLGLASILRPDKVANQLLRIVGLRGSDVPA